MGIVHHSVSHQQQLGADALSRSDDAAFYDAQLERAIALALVAVGYDRATPEALESFRGEVEQCTQSSWSFTKLNSSTNDSSDMLRFLTLTRSAMESSRRSQPIPQDWIYALAHLGVKSSDLSPHINLPLAPEITQPPLSRYDDDDDDNPPLPAADSILGPQLTGLAFRQKYVPAHLPPIPSLHTWRHTAIYPKREEDARKIRELATAEGVMAEKAMRKLMASGAHAKTSHKDRRSPKDQLVWEEAMKEVLRLDEEQRLREEAAAAVELAADGFHDGANIETSEAQPDIDSTMLVNYEERFWRPTGQKRKH
jgi:transcription initiation factor TFIID subunit 8